MLRVECVVRGDEVRFLLIHRSVSPGFSTIFSNERYDNWIRLILENVSRRGIFIRRIWHFGSLDIDNYG